MLKELVKYTDYNDVAREETLYFNLTKVEMLDLIDLQPRLEAWSNLTAGEPRDLTTSEIQELLDIVKLLIEKSYGERSEDGKHFRKSAEIFDNFKQSAIYDSFVFGLFQYPERAILFMIGILPKGIADDELNKATNEALGLASEMQKSREMTSVDIPLPPQSEIQSVTEEKRAWIRENREPTRQELATMSREDMQEAFARKNRTE